MYIVCGCISILCITFFILYIKLKLDVKSLGQQLQYREVEDSKFTLYSTSSDKEMKKIIAHINALKVAIQDATTAYLRNEKDIQDMIANISHDIRTPLTSIQGYVEMIQHSEDAQERKRYYQIVMHRLQDLETMLDEFFLYTKLMNSSNRYVLESKELYPLVCQTLLNYMDLLKANELLPQVICDDESITAQIHEEALQRICMNLIINAIRYGKNPFLIILMKEGTGVSLVFENACEKDLSIDVAHMFDRFFKGDTARTQKGSGLGLAIVKELSSQMNATLKADYAEERLRIVLHFENL